MSHSKPDKSQAAALDELKRALAFDERDAARLRELSDDVRPHMETIADAFYARIEAHPLTRQILADRGRIAHLKTTLVAWMDSSLRGPHDEAFYVDRARIGRMHVRAGLPQAQMLATMNLIREAFHDVAEGLDRAESPAIRSSIDKLIDLELAIMLESYREDGEIRLRQSERKRVVEELRSSGALTTGLADELRNPLNSACLQLRVLDAQLHRAQADTSVRRPLALARSDVERLAQIVDNVLSLVEGRR